jgi:mono/diheme cytochrome c family protein
MSNAMHQAKGFRLAGLLFAGAFLGCGGYRPAEEGYPAGEIRPLEQASAEEELAGMNAGADRGRYLATAVSLCTFCHSEIDWKAEGFPPKTGTVGGGRAPFSEAMPWLTSPNISPDRETGAGTWSDTQFEQALRRGIGHDGRTLHPAMPYHSYHGMSDDDAGSLAQFLRSMPPVKNKLPATQIPEEMKAGFSPLPPAGTVKAPERSQTVRYGEYLAQLALCSNCHTPRDQNGKVISGMEFAGGSRLKGPWGEISALNITPDPTGIDDLSEKIFMSAMKTGHLPGVRLNAIMPWGYYRQMTDDDLRAIFAYVKTLKPVKHSIDNTTPPTPCKKCGGTHGQGSEN